MFLPGLGDLLEESFQSGEEHVWVNDFRGPMSHRAFPLSDLIAGFIWFHNCRLWTVNKFLKKRMQSYCPYIKFLSEQKHEISSFCISSSILTWLRSLYSRLNWCMKWANLRKSSFSRPRDCKESAGGAVRTRLAPDGQESGFNDLLWEESSAS